MSGDTQDRKLSRNAPCSCGSGRKYKHCCGHPSRRLKPTQPHYFTVEIPPATEIYYLDTCCWSPLAESESARIGVTKFFKAEKRVLALSVFTAFELTRAPKPIVDNVDNLLFSLRQHIHFAAIYDQVIESELASFPRLWRMRWLPLEAVVDYDAANMLEIFASHPLFKASRDEHYEFGLKRFMSLEELKPNFPPLHGPEYTLEDADHFAYATTLDYLSRQFPDFLRENKRYFRKYLSRATFSMLSLRIRSLFLFLKYYVHGQSPGPSDFFDFAQISYAPYCTVFVTERNASNVLRRIKTAGLMLENTDILHVSEFIERMEKYA